MKRLFPISRRSVFYNASILALSGVVLQGLGFLYRILQSRLIGAEGMGMYSLIHPVYGVITSVALAGVCAAVNHLTAEADARGSSGALIRIFSAGAAFVVLLFTLMASALIFGHEKAASLLLGKPETGRAMLLFLPCIFLTGFENLCKNACYGLKHVGAPAVSEITEQIVRIGAVCAVILLLKPETPLASAECVILGMTASEVFSALFMTVTLTRIYRERGEGGPPFPRPIAGGVIRIALPVSLSALAGNLIASSVTLILPGRLMTAGLSEEEALSAIGRITGMAFPLMLLPLTFVYPVGAAVAPRITGSMALEKRADAGRKAARALEIAALASMPLSFLLIPAGPFLVKTVFGAEVDGKTLFLMALGCVAMAFQTVSSSILTGYGKHRFAMASGLLGGILHLALVWFFAGDPAVGVRAEVIGAAAGSALPALINLLRLAIGLRLRLSARRLLLGPLFLTIPAVLCEKAAIRLLGGELPGILLGILTGGIVAAAAAYAWGYRPGRYLRTLIPREGLQKEDGGRVTCAPPESAEETAASEIRRSSGNKRASGGSAARGSSVRRAFRNSSNDA